MGIVVIASFTLLSACRKAKQSYTPLERDRVLAESGQHAAQAGQMASEVEGRVRADAAAHAEAIRNATVNGANANIDLLPPADPDGNMPKPSYDYPDPGNYQNSAQTQSQTQEDNNSASDSTYPRPPLTNETHHLYGDHEKIQDMAGNWVLRAPELPVPSATVKPISRPQNNGDSAASSPPPSAYTNDGSIPDVPDY